MTAAEYLEIERKAAFKSEFVRGEMMAMSGGPVAHAVLIGRVAWALDEALEDGPSVVTVSQLRLEVVRDEVYVYPDVMVFRDGFALAEGHPDIVTNPLVVVEVLAEATEAWERGGKFGLYQGVATLREYVLVSTTAMRVEWFTREEDGRWSYRKAEGPEGAVRLETLGVTLGLGRIYRKVELG